MRIFPNRILGLFGFTSFFFNCKDVAKEMMFSPCPRLDFFMQKPFHLNYARILLTVFLLKLFIKRDVELVLLPLFL